MTTAGNAAGAGADLSTRLRILFERAGARFVDVPVLHPADPFLETAGEDIRRRMFVTEGPTGERLALRPDFTIPVCLEHLRRAAPPQRYAYEGLVFRRHDSGAPERPEAGFEDIGDADRTAADAEALVLAVEAAAATVAGPLSVRLGDIGLFVALLKALGLPEPWRRRLRRSYGVAAAMAANLDRLSAPRNGGDTRLDDALRAAADSHDRNRLVELVAGRLASHGHQEGAGRTPEEIAERFLDQRELSEARIGEPALAALRAFLALQAPLGDAPAVLRDLSQKHGLDLGEALAEFSARAEAIGTRNPDETLVFEVRGTGQSAPIVGGGRYDRLMQMLGAPAPVPAVGFTMRLDLATETPR